MDGINQLLKILVIEYGHKVYSEIAFPSRLHRVEIYYN